MEVTNAQFMQAVEAYYGRYERPAQRDMVLQYIGRFSELDLAALYGRLLLDFSGKFRFAPDVAVIEETKRGLDKDGWPKSEVKRIPEGPYEPCMPKEEVRTKLADLFTRLTGKRLPAQDREKAIQEKKKLLDEQARLLGISGR